MSTHWIRIAALATVLIISGPVLAGAQSSQTKSETRIPGMGFGNCRGRITSVTCPGQVRKHPVPESADHCLRLFCSRSFTLVVYQMSRCP